jgi:hypothetical protein
VIKQYLIYDNFLDNPEDIVTLMHSCKYYSSPRNNAVKVKKNDIPLTISYDDSFDASDPRSEHTGWMGYRSKDLQFSNPGIHNAVFNNLFSKIFHNFYITKLDYFAQSYFHLFTEDFTASDYWYHVDQTVIFAGVLYLQEKPEKNSGTILNIDNNKIFIENKFNRLVVYNGMIPHRVEGVFGNSLKTCRSTLNLFLHVLSINSDFKL